MGVVGGVQHWCLCSTGWLRDRVVSGGVWLDWAVMGVWGVRRILVGGLRPA